MEQNGNHSTVIDEKLQELAFCPYICGAGRNYLRCKVSYLVHMSHSMERDAPVSLMVQQRSHIQ